MPGERQEAADTLVIRVLDMLRGQTSRVRAVRPLSSPIWAEAIRSADLTDRGGRPGGMITIHVYVPMQEVGSPARVKVEWTRTAIPVWWTKEVYLVGGVDDPKRVSLSLLRTVMSDIQRTIAKSIRLVYLHRKYPKRRRLLGSTEPRITLGGLEL